MEKDKRILVAEAMRNLEQALFDNLLGLVFQYEQELCELMGEEFSMGFLYDLILANQGTGNLVVDVYFLPAFQSAGLIGGES